MNEKNERLGLSVLLAIAIVIIIWLLFRHGAIPRSSVPRALQPLLPQPIGSPASIGDINPTFNYPITTTTTAPANVSNGTSQCGCNSSIIDSYNAANSALTGIYNGMLATLASIQQPEYRPSISTYPQIYTRAQAAPVGTITETSVLIQHGISGQDFGNIYPKLDYAWH